MEFSQLFSPRRVTSVVDLITNTFGSTVGAVTGWIWTRWIWPVLSRPDQAVAGRASADGVVRLAVAAGLVVAGFPTPDPWLWASELLTWTLAGGLLRWRRGNRAGVVNEHSSGPWRRAVAFAS